MPSRAIAHVPRVSCSTSLCWFSRRCNSFEAQDGFFQHLCAECRLNGPLDDLPYRPSGQSAQGDALEYTTIWFSKSQVTSCSLRCRVFPNFLQLICKAARVQCKGHASSSTSAAASGMAMARDIDPAVMSMPRRRVPRTDRGNVSSKIFALQLFLLHCRLDGSVIINEWFPKTPFRALHKHSSLSPLQRGDRAL